jgi:hypothetical protein
MHNRHEVVVVITRPIIPPRAWKLAMGPLPTNVKGLEVTYNQPDTC